MSFKRGPAEVGYVHVLRFCVLTMEVRQLKPLNEADRMFPLHYITAYSDSVHFTDPNKDNSLAAYFITYMYLAQRESVSVSAIGTDRWMEKDNQSK